METTVQKSDLFSSAAKKGAILGIIHIILFLVMYLFFPSKLTGFSYLGIILIINISYCIYEGIQYRNSVGGFIEFGSAFKYIFVLLAVNGLLNILFSMLFIVFDPSFPEQMAQAQLDTSLYWAERFGAPVETLDQMEDNFNKEDMIKNYSFFGLIKSYGIGLLIYAVGALILSLFVKKNKPETF